MFGFGNSRCSQVVHVPNPSVRFVSVHVRCHRVLQYVHWETDRLRSYESYEPTPGEPKNVLERVVRDSMNISQRIHVVNNSNVICSLLPCATICTLETDHEEQLRLYQMMNHMNHCRVNRKMRWVVLSLTRLQQRCIPVISATKIFSVSLSTKQLWENWRTCHYST